MKLVNLFKAAPGMVLAENVKNKDGRHLMSAGTLLGKNELRILKMWGIPEISVEEGSKDNVREKGGENEAKIDRFIRQRFKYNSIKDPVISEISDLAKEWFAKHPERMETLEARLKANPANLISRWDGNKVDPQALLEDKVSLPALPQIYSEISAAIKDPACSGKEIADIVSKDTSLSATLLKIVNSAFYGVPEEIDSLIDAALTLGTHQICTLALGITVINYFKEMPGEALDMEAFWRHSLGCAVMARNLATHIPEVDGERVFIGGLLHDIGRLIFLTHFPKAAMAALGKSGKLKLSLDKIEPGLFDIDHALFGSQLADTWNFSPRISGLIRDHHKGFKETPDKEVAVVYFSNWMVSVLGIGFSGEILLPKLNKNAWAAMAISTGTLEPVIRQTDRQVSEAVRFFYG